MRVVSSRWSVVGKALTLYVMLFALCLPASAQHPRKIQRVGLLLSASTAVTTPYIEAFRQGMRDLGYVEGKNYFLEIRGGGVESDRLLHLAAELVRLKVQIIVAGGNPAVRAAMKATSTIPIVMRTGTDPVEAGYIPSLARPGGNVTGVTSMTTKLIGKHLELLAEMLPEMKRVAVLVTQADPTRFMARVEYKEMEAAARPLGVRLQVLSARDPDTIDKAFLAITKERSQALMVTPSAWYVEHGKQILQLSAKNHLPAIYFVSSLVENGGLLSYAPSNAGEFRRAASYVDRILKGAKPADLPVEQPTKFELVINLKAAKQIGLVIPPNILARADKVIR